MTTAPETNAPATAPTFDEVFAYVLEVLRGIVGDDYLEVAEVSPATQFETDLELESMEIVQLAEDLMGRYPQVDFIGWFATMELDQLIELSVGAVVQFIVDTAAGEPSAN